MREVIARSEIQSILTEGRLKIETDVQQITQRILDEYGSGIQVTQVQTQKLIHQVKLLIHSEMCKQQELTENDLRMKQKLMLMMLFQGHEEKQKKFLQEADAYKQTSSSCSRG